MSSLLCGTCFSSHVREDQAHTHTGTQPLARDVAHSSSSTQKSIKSHHHLSVCLSTSCSTSDRLVVVVAVDARLTLAQSEGKVRPEERIHCIASFRGRPSS